MLKGVDVVAISDDRLQELLNYYYGRRSVADTIVGVYDDTIQLLEEIENLRSKGERCQTDEPSKRWSDWQPG